MAGAFFSDGSYTKNTPEEVKTMMSKLQEWSTLPFERGDLETLLPEERLTRINYQAQQSPLTAMEGAIDLQRYMGRWYVQANIPTYFDKGTINNIEDYHWDEERQMVLVSFKYCAPVTTTPKSGAKDDAVVTPGPVKEILQHGTLVNTNATEWALKVKLLFYVPVPARYLVLAVNEGVTDDAADAGAACATGEYRSCMIGVPDRSALWIMSRDKTPLSEDELGAYVLKANLLGYDVSKIGRVPIVEPVQP